jgi:hypothetical protein
MHKNATKCNETLGKWCKNKHGASKIIDTFETYQSYPSNLILQNCRETRHLPILTTWHDKFTLDPGKKPLPDLDRLPAIADPFALNRTKHPLFDQRCR